MNLYTKVVKFIGLNGKEKEKALHFQITRKMSLEHQDTFSGMESLALQLQTMDPNSLLTAELGMRLLKESLVIIKTTYAEVDFDNDIIEQSPEATKRFENSLAYEALLKEFLDDPMTILDVVKEITKTAPLDEEQKTEVQKLQEQYISKTQVQNDNNHGQTNTVDLEKERKRIELQKQLDELNREE